MRKEEIISKQVSNGNNVIGVKIVEQHISAGTRDKLFKITNNNRDLNNELKEWANTGFKSDKQTLERFGHIISPQMLKDSRKIYSKNEELEEEE